jgi:hypothetical protein
MKPRNLKFIVFLPKDGGGFRFWGMYSKIKSHGEQLPVPQSPRRLGGSEEVRAMYFVGQINRIIEEDPVSGCLFFKHLSGVLGSRLLQSYRMISGKAQAASPVVFGTGQVMESEATTS